MDLEIQAENRTISLYLYKIYIAKYLHGKILLFILTLEAIGDNKDLYSNN